MQQTKQQYDTEAAVCRTLFLAKTKDYGTAWRILRVTSLTDQLLIKAKRIRTIEEKGSQEIGDPIADEFRGIVNYCIMALIQLELTESDGLELDINEATNLYDKELTITRQLMLAKNSDYGEVWRDMRVSSMTDLILMKILRVKQIESNFGARQVSEGVDANYRDMINYALFALIKLSESSDLKS